MAYSSVHTHTCTHHRKVDSSAGVIHPNVQSLLPGLSQGTGWVGQLPSLFLAVIPILPFPVLCHSASPPRCTSSQGLVVNLSIKLGRPSDFHRGAHVPWSPVLTAHSAQIPRLRAPRASQQPLSWSLGLPHYPYRCWGQAGQFECGFHRKAVTSAAITTGCLSDLKSHRRKLSSA